MGWRSGERSLGLSLFVGLAATYVAFFVSFPYHKTSACARACLRRRGEAMTAKSALFTTAKTTTTHTKMNPSCCILKQQGGKWAHAETHMLGRCLCYCPGYGNEELPETLLAAWEATVPIGVLLSKLLRGCTGGRERAPFKVKG